MTSQNQYYEDLFQNNFPAPDPREKQKPAVKETIKAFHDDKHVVQIDAPPGLGKSVILATIARAMDGEVFYATPLNTLVDQLENDDFVGKWIMTMKGQSHYECINDYAPPGVMVDKAPCQKQSNFDCEIKDECKYYGRRQKAMDHPFVVTNLSYLMADSMMKKQGNDSFEDREILIVDECQNIDDFALDFVSFTISRNTVPSDVWKDISIPHEKHEDKIDKLVDWVEEELSESVKNALRKRQSKSQKSNQDLDEIDQLKTYDKRIDQFLQDCINYDWIPQIDFYGPNSGNNKIKFKPVTVGRFLHELLWDRADKIILSSATIPKGNWLDEIGFGDADVMRLNVGSLFDVENRPIITSQSVGKMTYNKRDGNAIPMAKKIKEIADFHSGEKGIVHCRSYGMQEMLQNAFYESGNRDWFDKNTRMQKQMDREGSLRKWIAGDKQLFFSVNMSEGISLDHDMCRFQILAKVLYPHMGDRRTKYRVEDRGEWTWYNNQAAIQIEQAYGRAVRAEDDYAAFYMLDESAEDLIERNTELFHDWFLEAMVETNHGNMISSVNMPVLSDRDWL